MRKLLPLTIFILAIHTIDAQEHLDFIGAGHDREILVSTSHAQGESGNSTLDGFDVSNQAALADASRFLAQTTMGYDFAMIRMVAAMGFEAWLDEQFSLPRQSYKELSEQLEVGSDEYQGISNFRSTWWNYVLSSPDQLRQRINYNLSELLVVSGVGSDAFEDQSNLSTAYYDVLGEHSLGNYRDLLRNISLNPSMGIYLSHFNNPKADPSRNIHPDENYAREIMQLFSIGLYELNPDGSLKMGTDGKPLATYTNADIREFAKVFTGFGDGRPEGVWGTPIDDIDLQVFATFPMKMYQAAHEPGEKRLLNGQIVPAGQNGMKDLEDAIDNLFNHPNVSPFIGKALIQFLVSSNPSPRYIQQVSSAFENNGRGGRGDMKAILKAVLLDPEARNCNPLGVGSSGKMREPLLRYSGFLRAFQVNQQSYFVDNLGEWIETTGQAPVFAPSVFNFYLPAYQPQGAIAEAGLVAPVFQIHNSSTSIGYINKTEVWAYGEGLMELVNPLLDFSAERALASDPSALVNRLNILLACGQLAETTQSIISTAITMIDDPEERVATAIYLTMMAPDYVILK